MSETLTAASRGTIDSALRPYLPKYVRILGQLRRRALETPEGQSFGTVAGWKEEFGVSQATIDRALQELRREGLIRSQRGKGSHATRPSNVRHLGIFFGLDIFDPGKGEFPLLMLKALRHAVSSRHCILRYYLPPSGGDILEDRVSSLRGDIQNRLVDGLIFWAASSFRDEDLPIPAVALIPRPGVSRAVRLDDTGMVRMAANELLRLGCRRIALLQGGWSTMHEMAPVFMETLRKGGGVSFPEWQRGLHGLTAQDSSAVGKREFEALWKALPEKPDGLVSCDDYATTGVLEALRELGIRPGSSLRIASHANKGSTLLANAAVSRVEFDPDDIAGALLTLVEQAIEGQTQPEVITVAPHVITS